MPATAKEGRSDLPMASVNALARSANSSRAGGAGRDAVGDEKGSVMADTTGARPAEAECPTSGTLNTETKPIWRSLLEFFGF